MLILQVASVVKILSPAAVTHNHSMLKTNACDWSNSLPDNRERLN